MQDTTADRSFIEQVFQKRECACFVGSSKDSAKCGCGRSRPSHTCASSHSNERWTISKHTIASPTDSYGTIEFQGGPHPHKAQFVRLGFDSEPDQILHLFEAVWNIERPKLVISVHGGMANFNLQHKLARVFRKGLFKAAKTTGAWIITSGLNTGVVRHVASALNDGGRIHNKKKIFTIGIAPWGLLKKRDNLVGRDVTVPYHPQAFSPRGRFAVLSDKHSHFLLVDNGTVGRYGADIILRKRFEEFISQQRLESSGKRIPVVCVVLEGGTCTIRAVLDYVTNFPPVPVVVCDGSGRAADLLAFTHKYAGEDGSIDPGLRSQILLTIQNVFDYSLEQAEKVFLELMLCVRKKHLVTIFRLGEDQTQDIDHAILTALLKGQDLSAPDQLSLALTWDRVDIARSDIFVYGQEWPPGALDSAMMDALLLDRVEFVKLLLENGVSMERFLTMQRLEELFNTEKGPSYSAEALRLIVQDVVKNVGPRDRLRLEDIGCVIQKLMGGGYRATYCRKDFKKRYAKLTKSDHKTVVTPIVTPRLFVVPSRKSFAAKINNPVDEDEKVVDGADEERHFEYPFNELLLWAVLFRRQKMALCMWQHGEEAMSKALVACKLYKSMATEAAEDYLEEEICENLKKFSDEFKKLALELLEICYQANEDLTCQLLTYELLNWGKQTCISLAVSANHKEFLAHPGCQILLSDLWLGGMRIRKNSNLKVLLALICFPVILKLDFKTKQELMLQPQTKEEHIEDMRDDLGSSVSINTEDRYSDVEARTGENHHTDSDSDKEPLRTPDRKQSLRQESVSSVHAATPDGFTKKLHLLSRRHSRSNEHVNQVQQKLSMSPSAAQERTNSIRMSPGVFRETPMVDPKRKSFEQFRGTLQLEKGYRNRHLGLMRKIREFYIAPITTFWSYTLSYLLFVVVFTYVVLVRTDPVPSWAELYVICFIVTYGCEKIRKFVMLEPRDFNQKLKVFCENYWNITSSIAVIVFVIGVILRFSHERSTMEYGRVLYCIEIVFWYLKSLEFLSVNKYVGPYITMVGKMIANMVHITLILFIVMSSFGIFRQSVLFPYKDWDWQLVRNIFYKPYFMLYGEVYAFEIDTCGDENKDCVTGGWLTPAFMCIFLLVCNILLINLLIAVFNFIYLEVNAVSHQVWKFQRYNLVMEYEQRPWLPPPLIVFCHLYLLFKFCFRKAGGRHTFDRALKLFLDAEDVEKLHDFEEECMEDLFRQRDIIVLTSTEDRIRRTTDKVEFLSMKLDDASHKQAALSSNMQLLDVRTKRIEDLLEATLSSIQDLQSGMYHFAQTMSKSASDRSMKEPVRGVDIVVSDHSGEEPSHQHLLRPPSGILSEGGLLSVPGEGTSAETGPLRKRSSSELVGPDRTSKGVVMRPARGRLSNPVDRSVKSALNVPLSYREPFSPSPTHAVLERKRAKFYFSSSPQPSPQMERRQLPVDEKGQHEESSDDSNGPDHDGDQFAKEMVGRRSSLPTSPDYKRKLRGQLLSVPLVARHQSMTPRSPAYGEKVRPRNQEYTTITDSIDTTGILSPDTEDHPTTLIPEMAPRSRYNGASRGLQNAKWSFVVGQNELMKEYEEYGSRITGGLIRHRIKKNSGSVCAATQEELQEMGYDQFEYENYMRPRSETSHSSSLGSVTSAKIEDEEGFQQINECLNHKAQEKKMSDDYNSSSTPSAPTSPVLTPQAGGNGPSKFQELMYPLEPTEESD